MALRRDSGAPVSTVSGSGDGCADQMTLRSTRLEQLRGGVGGEDPEEEGSDVLWGGLVPGAENGRQVAMDHRLAVSILLSFQSSTLPSAYVRTRSTPSSPFTLSPTHPSHRIHHSHHSSPLLAPLR